MTSQHYAPAQNRTFANKRTLQRLRKDAGYRSAKDFAAELHIPSSTYSRYERQPEGPNCAIPLSAAWLIADKLRCSIDLVVGREDIKAQAKPTFEDRAESLSKGSQKLLWEYLAFLEYRDSIVKSQGRQ